jgi:outer membrane immunogenic protein
VNVGASFGNVKTDFNAPATLAETLTLGGVSASGSTTIGFAGSDREYPSGFIGGGQIGYNWQLSPIWVVGLETDFQGAVERDTGGALTNNFNELIKGTPPILFVTGVLGSTVLDYQTKIDWFGTVRGRIGYIWGNGNVMSYLTGGFAYGRVDLEGTSTVSGLFGAIPGPFSVTQAFGHSQVNTGWVLGYGTEGLIDFWGARNWTWKVEGLYMDLGRLDAIGSGSSFTQTVPAGAATLTANVTTPVTTHSHFTDGILRGGLNYKFN